MLIVATSARNSLAKIVDYSWAQAIKRLARFANLKKSAIFWYTRFFGNYTVHFASVYCVFYLKIRDKSPFLLWLAHPRGIN